MKLGKGYQMEIRTIRFWVWENDGWVKLSLRDGESVRWATGGYYDEGWSIEETAIKREGDWLHRVHRTDGTDCDGRLETFSRCRAHVLSDRGEEVDDRPPGRVPNWKSVSSSQRDYFAEAMGY